MNVKGFWTRKDEALFIDLIHQYPPLWDIGDKNYPKKSVKRRIYAQIADELKKRWPDKAYGLTSGSVRQKFNYLRTYFKKERGRMKINGGYSLPPKWVHYDKMLFLAEEDEINKSECDLNISIVNVQGGTMKDDIELEHGTLVPETTCPDSNERTDSSLSPQPPAHSNEGDPEPPLEQTSENGPPPACDSTKTDTPVILKAWSTSAKGPPPFNVAMGNLVVASLNQMPVEKANAATKEIFDVLLKYGRESNHLR